MSIEILDPSHEADDPRFQFATRLESVNDTTIGIISNGKKGTKPFFDALANALVERHGVAKVIRSTKLNYSAPAEAGLMQQAKTQQWDALIAGVGD